MSDRQPNPYPALRPGPVYPGPIYSLSPWAIYGGGTYPGYQHTPCTMGGGVVPNLNDTCGWTYRQWGPGMGSTYPSYSYKGYFPKFVPGGSYPPPLAIPEPVQPGIDVGVQYNAVAVGNESEQQMQQPTGFRPMLGSRFSRGRPSMAPQAQLGLQAPTQPSVPKPSHPSDTLGLCGGAPLKCEPAGATPQTPGAVCYCDFGQGQSQSEPLPPALAGLSPAQRVAAYAKLKFPGANIKPASGGCVFAELPVNVGGHETTITMLCCPEGDGVRCYPAVFGPKPEPEQPPTGPEPKQLQPQLAAVPQAQPVQPVQARVKNEDDKEDRKPIILDVRTREEAAALPTIPGATNVPVDELPLRLRELVKAAGSADHPVAVYCKMGKRSALAKQFLEAAGFQNVSNLGGTHIGPHTDVLSWGRPVQPQAVTQAQLAGAA